jgi:hypothetical protein
MMQNLGVGTRWLYEVLGVLDLFLFIIVLLVV